VRHTAQALTRSRTSPAAGSGRSREVGTSGLPAAFKVIASISIL
jgi:hypothetical protein